MSSQPDDQATQTDAGAGAGPGEPSEAELRAAYEAELSRITSADVMLQSAVSLLNLGGRRLGLTRPDEPNAASSDERDLEQVRDAIDGVRALLGVLERRLPSELGPLRDALSQLQIAYAREAQAGGESRPGTGEGQPDAPAAPAPDAAPGAPGQPRAGEQKDAPSGEEGPDGPGPAEASGRLWVPGR